MCENKTSQSIILQRITVYVREKLKKQKPTPRVSGILALLPISEKKTHLVLSCNWEKYYKSNQIKL